MVLDREERIRMDAIGKMTVIFVIVLALTSLVFILMAGRVSPIGIAVSSLALLLSGPVLMMMWYDALGKKMYALSPRDFKAAKER